MECPASLSRVGKTGKVFGQPEEISLLEDSLFCVTSRPCGEFAEAPHRAGCNDRTATVLAILVAEIVWVRTLLRMHPKSSDFG